MVSSSLMVASADNAIWAQEAASLQLIRRDIARLAERLPSEAPCWIGAAYESHGPHAATVLALACAVNGWPLQQATLLHLLPEVDDIEHAAALMYHADAGLVELVLALLNDGRLSEEREAIALLLAVNALGDAEPPAAIVARLRQLARVPGRSAVCIAAAAKALGDPELDRLVLRLSSKGYEEVHRFARELGRPVIEVPPTRAPPRLVQGYTVKSLERKVGRNDPCPCGSGKKYKKCCERARPTQPPSPAGLTDAHFAPGAAAEIGDDQFALMRPHELKRLDPKELSTRRLIQGARALMAFHRWDTAETWIQELVPRTDQPGGGNPEDWWDELATRALDANNLELARRCRDQIKEPELASRLDLVLLLAARDIPALNHMEDRLRHALSTGQYDDLYTIAFGLLDHYPALGMLFARGCLIEERYLDSDTLMHGVEASRDQLGLSVGDPYWDVWDWMGERRRRTEGVKGFNTEQVARLRELEQRMQARQEEVESLRAELRTQEAQLREAEQLPKQAAEPTPAASSPTEARASAALDADDSSAADELERLRGRVQQLKALLKEGAQERQALRADLKSLESAVNSAKSVPPPAEPDSDSAGALEEPHAAAGPVPLRMPCLDTEKLKQLRSFNPELATRAVQRLGELASGDPGAWRQVKRLSKYRSLLSIRLGIHHRMLLSTTSDEVRLVDVIHRKDLERAIERHAQ